MKEIKRIMKKIKNIYIKYREIINYLIVGVLTTLVSLSSYFLVINVILSEKSDLNVQIANIISWICAVTFAYYTNRIYVFQSSSKAKEKTKEIIKFFSSRILSLIIDMLLMYILYSILKINDTISKLIVQVVVTILNYIFAKIIVFKNKN